MVIEAGGGSAKEKRMQKMDFSKHMCTLCIRLDSMVAGANQQKKKFLAATVGYLKVDYTPHLLSIDMPTRKNKGVGGASNVSIA